MTLVPETGDEVWRLELWLPARAFAPCSRRLEPVALWLTRSTFIILQAILTTSLKV